MMGGAGTELETDYDSITPSDEISPPKGMSTNKKVFFGFLIFILVGLIIVGVLYFVKPELFKGLSQSAGDDGDNDSDSDDDSGW